MRNLSLVFIFSMFFAFISGCASTIDATIAPNVDLSQLKTIYVKKQPADKWDIDVMITDKLNSLGLNAVRAPDNVDAAAGDAILTYEDRWQWDITMYLLELKVYIKDPKTQFIMASGFSHRTSLVRAEPVVMVDEVITKIFTNNKGE